MTATIGQVRLFIVNKNKGAYGLFWHLYVLLLINILTVNKTDFSKIHALGHDKYISRLLNYFTYIFPFDNKQQLINDSVFCMN